MTRHLASILIMTIALTACGSGVVRLSGPSASSKSTVDQASAVHVEVYEIKQANNLNSIPALVSVEGVAAVLSRRDGIIKYLGVQEGSPVKRDQLLAELEGDESQMQLNQADLEVKRLQYEEKQYEASIKVNANELDRQLILAKEGIVSQADVERARFKLEVSQQELEKTRLATRQAQSKVDALKMEVEKAFVRAPIDGVVTQRLARPGSNVVRNEKLFEVSKLSPLEVRFQVPQSDQWTPRAGQAISILTSESRRVSAHIKVGLPVAEASSSARTYVARLDAGYGLLPGAAVTVLRPGQATFTPITIPRVAFAPASNFAQGEKAQIFVAEGGICRERIVTVGKLDGDQVEVLAGLSSGDRVILAPPENLKPGSAVSMP